jgi:hypothetical protein
LIDPWNHRYLTENPRVGGSIPPLATNISRVYSGQIGKAVSRDQRNTFS